MKAAESCRVSVSNNPIRKRNSDPVLLSSYILHSQFCASRNRSAAGLLQLVVNKPISGCVRSPCTGLSWQVRNGLSTAGLLQAVVTELQQWCFQQACHKLLTQSCSNAVFNNLRQTCCEPRKAPYAASCIHYFEQKTAKQVAICRLWCFVK